MFPDLSHKRTHFYVNLIRMPMPVVFPEPGQQASARPLKFPEFMLYQGNFWDHVSHAVWFRLGVTTVSRNEVKMDVPDDLACCLADIYAEVIA